MRAIGAKPGRIIKRHILPNCLSVIIISAALQVPSAIFTESYLSFLGLGVRAPMPSLGSLANAAREGLQSYPYKLVFPALTIFDLFDLPALAKPNEEAAKRVLDVHGKLALAIGALALIHIGAALHHYLILKDGVMRRMLPWLQ